MDLAIFTDDSAGLGQKLSLDVAKTSRASESASRRRPSSADWSIRSQPVENSGNMKDQGAGGPEVQHRLLQRA